MTDLPKQVDRRVRRELATLDRPWKLIKKRDHYFVLIGDAPMICVANNSSKATDYQTAKTLERIRKASGRNR